MRTRALLIENLFTLKDSKLSVALMLDLFDDFENQVLDAALNRMKERLTTLNTLRDYKLTEKGLGIEGWFTIELLTDEKFHNWGTKKLQTPSDLKIQDRFVELKALSDTDFTWITDWWKKRKIKPSLVLFLSVNNKKMEKQIEGWRDRGHQIKFKSLNKDWIVGIFNGMNLFWCELWKYRKVDILKLKKVQLNKVIKITEKHVENYKNWIESVNNELKIEWLKALTLKDHEIMDIFLDTTFKVT